MQLQKEQQIDNKLKINYNSPENALEAVKPYFGRQNMFDCSFFAQRYCIIWPVINKNKQQSDKKEKKCQIN